jgi:hypothetical protein
MKKKKKNIKSKAKEGQGYYGFGKWNNCCPEEPWISSIIIIICGFLEEKIEIYTVLFY